MGNLTDLRASLTDEQREIINAIWRYDLERNRAIPSIVLCDAVCLDHAKVREALEPLGGDVVYAEGEGYVLRRYHLTFLGYLLAERGEELEDLLARYLAHTRNKLRSDPEIEKINIPDAMSASQFSEDQFSFFSNMFFRTPFHGGGSRTETNLPPRIDDWYGSSDLHQYVRDRAMENYDAGTPIESGRQNLIRSASLNTIQIFHNSQQLRNQVPAGLQESLDRFRADHPQPEKVSFVMMRFGTTRAHKEIVATIETVLEGAGMIAVRADGKEYHDDLLSNVLTYMHGCGSGIAVFERLEGETFNPNVSLEVGYMLALDKPVCFLKDRTLKTLHTDLIGKVYREFDPQMAETISSKLSGWLKDKGFHTGS